MSLNFISANNLHNVFKYFPNNQSNKVVKGNHKTDMCKEIIISNLEDDLCNFQVLKSTAISFPECLSATLSTKVTKQ